MRCVTCSRHLAEGQRAAWVSPPLPPHSQELAVWIVTSNQDGKGQESSHGGQRAVGSVLHPLPLMPSAGAGLRFCHLPAGWLWASP